MSRVFFAPASGGPGPGPAQIEYLPFISHLEPQSERPQISHHPGGPCDEESGPPHQELLRKTRLLWSHLSMVTALPESLVEARTSFETQDVPMMMHRFIRLIVKERDG
jgi:hypothetical protein